MRFRVPLLCPSRSAHLFSPPRAAHTPAGLPLDPRAALPRVTPLAVRVCVHLPVCALPRVFSCALDAAVIVRLSPLPFPRCSHPCRTHSDIQLRLAVRVHLCAFSLQCFAQLIAFFCSSYFWGFVLAKCGTFLRLWAATPLEVSRATLTGSAPLHSNYPEGVAINTFMNIYVADRDNHKIRLIYPNKTVITIAGGGITGTTPGNTNGVGTAALLYFPSDVALDTLGNLYVSDASNHKILLIYANLTVITIAGGSGATTIAGGPGSTDGVGTTALFKVPRGIALDTLGNLYVADSNNHKIRLIYPNKTVITIAGGGSTGIAFGNTNGIGNAARFFVPYGLALDSLGNVYVADCNNHKIRLIYPDQTVVTFAGGSTAGTVSGSTNGVGTAALFSSPKFLDLDTLGNVYVADDDNNKIRLIYPNKTVITIAGGGTSGEDYGNTNGVGAAALFAVLRGIALSPSGNVYVADAANNKIRLITSTCPAGTYNSSAGSASCQQCPGGHYCPAGTSSWARLNCGRGNYCPDGSGAPTPCPYQVPPTGGWGALQVQGPAFLVETAHCLNHCFWNFTSGDGVLSKC